MKGSYFTFRRHVGWLRREASRALPVTSDFALREAGGDFQNCARLPYSLLVGLEVTPLGGGNPRVSGERLAQGMAQCINSWSFVELISSRFARPPGLRPCHGRLPTI